MHVKTITLLVGWRTDYREVGAEVLRHGERATILPVARIGQCRTQGVEQTGVLEAKSEGLGGSWNMQDERKEASCLTRGFWHAGRGSMPARSSF